MLNFEYAPYIETGDYTAPNGIKSYFVPMEDKLKIRLCFWFSEEITNYRGTIILQQGYNEFIEKYYEVIQELINRKFAVVSFDWRGQGMSEREVDDIHKAHIEDFSYHIEDLRYVTKKIINPLFPRPFIGLGHSMGGCLLLSALANQSKDFDIMVLNAPMLGLKREFLLKLLSNLAHSFGKKDAYFWGIKPNMGKEISFNKNQVTSDKLRYSRTQKILRKNPNLKLWGVTNSWAFSVKNHLNQIRKPGWAENINTKILIMNSVKDEVVDSKSTAKIAERISQCKIVNFYNAKHEILMEQDVYRNKFWKNFDKFINDNLTS